MTKRAFKFFGGLCAAVAVGALSVGAAYAEDTIKVGLILTYSGGWADSAGVSNVRLGSGATICGGTSADLGRRGGCDGR